MMRALLNPGLRALALLLAFASPALSAADTHLVLNPHGSRIQISAQATGHSFTAQLKRYETDIEFTPDGRTFQRARCRFYFGDLDSGNSKRDAEMLTWLGNPQADGEFTLTSVGRDAGGDVLATGNLRLLGVTRPITLTCRVSHTAMESRIYARGTFKYTDFELAQVRKIGVLTVFPTIEVEFELKGTRIESQQPLVWTLQPPMPEVRAKASPQEPSAEELAEEGSTEAATASEAKRAGPRR